MKKNDHIVMYKDHMEELYNSKNILVRFVHKQRLNVIADIFPKLSNLKVFDAGCGEGHLLKTLYNLHPLNDYYGADITAIAIEQAKKRCPFANFELSNIIELKFKNEFFDVIIISEVLEHIFEYQKTINELKRILKPNGILIITFPNEILWTISRFFLGRNPIKVPDHVNSFTPKKINSIVELTLIKKINLPFHLPFFLSLTSLTVFKKIIPFH